LAGVGKVQIEAAELERILSTVIAQALASQQPFYATITTQVAALESREIKRDETLHNINRSLDIIVAQNLPRELELLEDRIQALEDERTKMSGLKDAFNWIPKAIAYAAIFIGLVVFWLESKVKGKG
jgi:hypothetical protein